MDIVQADGWKHVRTKGDHYHFKHPTKPGLVTIPHPNREIHPKTAKSVLKQAGLTEE